MSSLCLLTTNIVLILMSGLTVIIPEYFISKLFVYYFLTGVIGIEMLTYKIELNI